MVIDSVNGANNVLFKGNEIKTDEKQTKAPEQIKDGKKKLALAAAGIAVVTVAGIAIAAKIKSRKPVDVKLNDISFFNGKAFLNGENFSGIINDKLKNGDDIALEYVDGVIQNSTRSGSKNLTKTYNYNQDGSIKSIQTKVGDTITDFIKTKNGHVIKENGIITKTFSNGKHVNIIADFKNGKPIESKKYWDEKLRGIKKYSYDENEKLSQLETFRDGCFDEPYFKTKYTPNGSSITTKKDGRHGEGTVIREIKTKKDSPLQYDADVSVSKFNRAGSKTKYLKDGKKIIEETENYSSVYGNYGNPKSVGLQPNIHHLPCRYIDVLDNKTGEITHKRIYANGAYDIDKTSRSFQTGSKIEHFDSDGKRTGFSKIIFEKTVDNSDRYDDITTTYYREVLFDANNNKLSEIPGTYSSYCCKFND